MEDTNKKRISVICSPEDELILRLFQSLSEKNRLKSEGYMACLAMLEESQFQNPAYG